MTALLSALQRRARTPDPTFADHGGSALLRAWHGRLVSGALGAPEAKLLRRCAAPADAFSRPSFHALRETVEAAFPSASFQPSGRSFWSALALANAAITAAHVAADVQGASLGVQLAGPKDRPPPVKPVRVRRILAAETPDDFLPAMLDAVDIVEGRVNLASLATTALTWGRERTRNGFAFDYFGAVSERLLKKSAA